ncbi:MAG: molybdopterin biosynthesis protein, partial [Rhodobacteraceae bacterium]|nr:molybdopterin biosynthesis protein [Paracoccaceae bacterium]
CIFPERPADGLAPACSVAGVMGALPGVVGAMMAVEAIKEITGAGEGLRGRMLIYDALYAEARG